MEDPQGATLPASPDAPVRSRVADGPPARVGRYELLHELGRGGMGIVYLAYDAQLDRRIAIKLLRGRIDAVARARLLREARALARVNHPNVIGVHEIGVHDDQLYVAMELVAGTSLRQWQDAAPRSWSACVAAYAQAARGLAAAHAAGIVHRDFKPQNAMIEPSDPGTIGRVRVLDFGLAIQGARDDASSRDDDVEDSVEAERSLTANGALLGTPAYMAPEQIAGDPSTPATDQFALCVALWEALEGTRPFVGASVPALHAAILAGRPLAADARRGTPPWLLAVLRRGLASRPAERFPDMLGLVAELERVRPSRRALALRTGTAVAILGGAVAATWASTRTPDRCSAIGHELDDVWSTSRRDALRATLAEAPMPAAVEIAERTEAALTRWADGWMVARTEACELTQAHLEDPDPLAEARVQCLDQRRVAFTTLIDVLAAGEITRTAAALDAVAELPSVEACADPAYLVSAPPRPADPDLAHAVEGVRSELAQVRALIDAGDPRAARPIAEAARDHAAAIDYPPVVVEADDALADVRLQLGDYDGALASVRRAYVDAPLAHPAEQHTNLVLLSTILRLRGDAEAALAEARRSHALARARGLHDGHEIAESALAMGAALDELQQTDAAIATYGEGLSAATSLPPTSEIVAMLHGALAGAFVRAARFDDALAEYGVALADIETSRGPGHPGAGIAHINVAMVLLQRGDQIAALREAELGLAIVREALGDVHPTVAVARNNLASVLRATGDKAGAVRELRAAITILGDAIVKDSIDVALARANLGSTLQSLGRYEEALVELKSARDLLATQLGPDDPRLADVHDTLGVVLSDLEDHAAAAHEHRAALVMRERRLGPDHPDVARSHANIGADLHEAGDDENALAEDRIGLAIRERVLPPDHADITDSHRGLAGALAGLGRHADALAERRIVLAAMQRSIGIDPTRIAMAQARVAEELDALDATPEALGAARAALDVLGDSRGATGRSEAFIALVAVVIAIRGRDHELAASAGGRAREIAAAHADQPVTAAFATLAAALLEGPGSEAAWAPSLATARSYDPSTVLARVESMLSARRR